MARTATKIIKTDAAGWMVECEHPSCTNTIRVAKTVRFPGQEPIVATAPEARGCASHRI